MRIKKDVSKNLRHNERKATILHLLVKNQINGKYMFASDIAKKLGIRVDNALSRMSRLYRHGYIHRRKQRDKNHRGEYQYRFLKERGRRVSQELWIRMKLQEIDPRVTLNLKKQVPPDLYKQRQQFSMEYTKWLQQI